MSFRTKLNRHHVHFTISPHAPCPCGAERSYLECHAVGGLMVAACQTCPPLPTTKISQPYCYARPLADCGQKQSKEHYISEVLLRHLNLDDGLLVAGLHWQREEAKRIAPAALTAHILCERHNHCLSGLDAFAMRLFRSLDERGAEGSGKEQLFAFNGHDIERWLLKVLYGLLHSGNIRFDRPVDTALSAQWLEVLFGVRSFPDGCGLYVRVEVGSRFEGPRGLRINPIASKQKLSGIVVSVCGYDLLLSLIPMEDRVFQGARHAYRPFELHTSGTRFEKSVIFCWDGPADKGTISTTVCDATPESTKD